MLSHSPTETFALGRAFAESLHSGDVIALCGELGAGKTHFIKGLAAGLGCDPDAVTSPTFTLINEYTDGRLPLYHFDFYRLENGLELIRVGLDDYLDGNGVVAIEWADKFPQLLPKSTKWLYFRHNEDGSRSIESS